MTEDQERKKAWDALAAEHAALQAAYDADELAYDTMEGQLAEARVLLETLVKSPYVHSDFKRDARAFLEATAAEHRTAPPPLRPGLVPGVDGGDLTEDVARIIGAPPPGPRAHVLTCKDKSHGYRCHCECWCIEAPEPAPGCTCRYEDPTVPPFKRLWTHAPDCPAARGGGR